MLKQIEKKHQQNCLIIPYVNKSKIEKDVNNYMKEMRTTKSVEELWKLFFEHMIKILVEYRVTARHKNGSRKIY